MLPHLHVLVLLAAPLWLTNHTSQVKSMQTRGSLVITGSEFDSDQSVSSLNAQTGKVLWTSTALAQWTYGVAVSSEDAAPPCIAAFGCAFDTERTPVPPCELGLWRNTSDGASLAWKMPIADAELGAGSGPPYVAFTPDGKSIVATFIDHNSTTNPGAEYIVVVSVNGTASEAPSRALLGSGQGHGLHLATPAKVSSTTYALLSRPPPAPPPPAPTPPWLPANDCKPPCDQTSSCCNNPPSGQDRGICLGNKARPITNCSEVPHVERHSALPLPASTSVAGSLHFAVSLGVAGSPIDIAKTPAIDCNGSASCSFLGASPDLSMVLVNAAASAPGGACALQPMDPLRWGIALLRNGQSWPPAYSTAWAQCSTANNAKQLTAVRLTTRDTRVLAIFAHVTPGTMDVVGVEACSYDAVDGAELWCTPQLRCAGGSTLPAVNALSEDDHFVFHMASVGLLVVDAASREAPPIELLYGSGAVDDCCSATALAVAHGVAVASIPDGTFNPPWCSCQHSKLIGVALPKRS